LSRDAATGIVDERLRIPAEHLLALAIQDRVDLAERVERLP
jgi:hypothetical protein